MYVILLEIYDKISLYIENVGSSGRTNERDRHEQTLDYDMVDMRYLEASTSYIIRMYNLVYYLDV